MSAAKQGVDVAGILKRLGIDSINAGAWSGTLGWSKDVAGQLISSVNPATGETLAQVRSATATDYEAVMRSAVEAARAWRAVPAPRRGEAVRLLGDALRAAKADLGALVTLENGKMADVVIWNGDPLELRTPVPRVIIAGRDVGPSSKHTELYERYLNRPKGGAR